jgi:hypothetical protein
VQKNPNKFPAGFFTFEKYIWAYLVVQTRTWQVTTEQGSDISFVPIAEFLNHNPLAGGGAIHGDYFTINATRDYSEGDQVYDSYGPKTNFELLSVYGFLLPENPVKGMSLYFAFKENNLVHSIVEPLLKAVE